MSASPAIPTTGARALIGPARTWRNWARTVTAHPAAIARPRDVAEVAGIVLAARERGLGVKAVGSGHSFTAIAETDGVLVDISALTGLISIDASSARVRFRAGTRLADVPELLAPYGLAMTNLGDIDRQTLAGATSTGTHGTGSTFGGLATQITALTLVTADGALLEVSERENAELLPAARLGLGALGILVEIELQCVPAFLLRAVEHPESLDEVLDALDDRTAADHFEFYWWPHTERVMTKTNTRLGADAARTPVSPVAQWVEETLMSNGLLSAVCTIGTIAPRLTPPLNRLATRVYGDREYSDLSHEVFTAPRITRFRETEFAVPREVLPDAVRAVKAVMDRGDRSISFPVEVRTAAADHNWLSTAYGRESGYVAVHRFHRDPHEELFREVGAVLADFGGRPHWGKLHYLDVEQLAERYPRFDDFRAARDRLDPERVFGNGYLRRVLGH